MQITSAIKGLDKALGSLTTAKITAKIAERLAVTRVAMRLRDAMVVFARSGHPDHPNVISGELSGKLTYKVLDAATKTEAYVGSPTPYALFVEFGHKQQPGRFVPKLGKKLVASEVKAYPFARPAMLQVFDGGEAEKIFIATLKEKFGF